MFWDIGQLQRSGWGSCLVTGGLLVRSLILAISVVVSWGKTRPPPYLLVVRVRESGGAGASSPTSVSVVAYHHQCECVCVNGGSALGSDGA